MGETERKGWGGACKEKGGLELSTDVRLGPAPASCEERGTHGTWTRDGREVRGYPGSTQESQVEG